MNRLTRTLPILLAVALQILPLVRNLFLNPATGSNIAFILRWGIGTGAAVGAVDAVSGATNYFTSPTNFTGTVGVPFTNNLTIWTNGADPGAYFVITNMNTLVTATLFAGNTNKTVLPSGLTIKCVDNNNGNLPIKPVYAAMYGTPSIAVTNIKISVIAGFPGQTSLMTNIFITILPAASSSPPVITNNPVGVTNVAGANVTLSVTAGGVPAPAYQWRLLSSALSGSTNSSLTLTNVRTSQAGNYQVVITNAAGSVTSSVASLVVTNPLPPTMTAPAKNGNLFQFTFVPVVGLTNSVVTNSALSGGVWNVLTNVPPPANANPITVSDPFGSSNRFYRVLIQP